jgi:hypothetical protein
MYVSIAVKRCTPVPKQDYYAIFSLRNYLEALIIYDALSILKIMEVKCGMAVVLEGLPKYQNVVNNNKF